MTVGQEQRWTATVFTDVTEPLSIVEATSETPSVVEVVSSSLVSEYRAEIVTRALTTGTAVIEVTGRVRGSRASFITRTTIEVADADSASSACLWVEE